MKKDWARRQTQVVLRDLEAWVVQLWEDHHLRVRLYVSLPSPGDGIKHGVTLEAYQPLPRGQESIAHRDWRTVEETTSGAIEAAALQMASALLLSLEGDRERAQRQAPLPF